MTTITTPALHDKQPASQQATDDFLASPIEAEHFNHGADGTDNISVNESNQRPSVTTNANSCKVLVVMRTMEMIQPASLSSSYYCSMIASTSSAYKSSFILSTC